MASCENLIKGISCSLERCNISLCLKKRPASISIFNVSMEEEMEEGRGEEEKT